MTCEYSHSEAYWVWVESCESATNQWAILTSMQIYLILCAINKVSSCEKSQSLFVLLDEYTQGTYKYFKKEFFVLQCVNNVNCIIIWKTWKVHVNIHMRPKMSSDPVCARLHGRWHSTPTLQWGWKQDYEGKMERHRERRDGRIFPLQSAYRFGFKE